MERVIKMLPKGIPADAISGVECDPYDSVNKDFGPSYWVYLKAGWRCEETECHTIHEDTLADIKAAIKTVRAWPDDPELEWNQQFGEEHETPSAEAGDYSPGNPWDAPGMSIRDFI